MNPLKALGLVALLFAIGSIAGCFSSNPDDIRAFVKPYEVDVTAENYVFEPPDEVEIHCPDIPPIDMQRQRIRPDGKISFKELGEIEVAGTVALMLDRVRAAPPSMLIVDFHLPDGNALRTLPLLKALAPAMKIAAFSNDATTFHRAASLQAGADWFFDKSAEFPQLLDLVRDRAAAH